MLKIAVVGAGFCGLAVTWQLLKYTSHYPDVTLSLFDQEEIGKGTSGIAAGLLHPFTGAHAKLNAMGHAGIEATRELLAVAAEALGRSVIAHDQGILRLALEEMQRNDFQKCVERFPDETKWLEATDCQVLAPGCAYAPGLWLKNGITVYSSLYVKGLWEACRKKGVTFEQRHIASLEEMADFDMTILTTGAESIHFPELSQYPLKNVKGQMLEFAWPKELPPLNCALNSHLYLLMKEEKTSCLVGATYEKTYATEKVDLDVAKKEILLKAYTLFPPLREMEILNCYAGKRAVGPQHLPLMQRCTSSVWLLTGMGSKGLLYHALFAKKLIENIFSEISPSKFF